MATRYTVGEDAPSPLVITVQRSDGTPVDLSAYAEVAVEGAQLPPGASSALDASGGVVQRSFDTGFTEAGMLMMRVRLVTSGGAVDYSGELYLPVAQPGPDETVPLFMSTDAVEAITGSLVSGDDVITAQNLVSLAIGADLGDADLVVQLSTADQFWLQLAVAYQATEGADAVGGVAAQDAFGIAPIPGVSSVRNGDIQVTFDVGSGGSTAALIGRLHPNTQLAIRRLSWLGAVRTLQAAPFMTERVRPDPWVLMYQLPARLVL